MAAETRAQVQKGGTADGSRARAARPARGQHGVAGGAVPALLSLQRLAGNQAVAQALARGHGSPVVQHCGPGSCDCPGRAERSADAAVQRELTVQRVNPAGRADCQRPDSYRVPTAIVRAKLMVAETQRAVGAPTAATRHLLRSMFGKQGSPTVVGDKLSALSAQLGRFARPAPADPATAGGHLCLDQTAGDLLAQTDGVGDASVLKVGTRFRESGVSERAYNVVHEAAHGAPELNAKDHAYSWHRLFESLTPDEALDNADSLAVLVCHLNGMRVRLPSATTEAVGYAPAVAERLKRVRAWLEQYVTQAMLQIRDLAGDVREAVSTGTFPRDGYPKQLYGAMAQHFGLPVPPGPPQQAAVDAIYANLDHLTDTVSVEHIRYHDGPQPALAAQGQRVVALPAAEVTQRDDARLAKYLLFLDCREGGMPVDDIRPHVELVAAIGGDFGGPWGGNGVSTRPVPPGL